MSTPHAGEPGGPLATLALTGGPRAGETLPLLRPVVTVGRAAGCDVVIDDDSVSAQHARLEWETGEWRITDLGSVNGTAVDGVSLSPRAAAPLPSGAAVRLGGVAMRFMEAAGADPAGARAAFVPEPPPATLRQERRGTRLPLWLALLLLALLLAAGYLLGTGTLRIGRTPAGGVAPALFAQGPPPPPGP